MEWRRLIALLSNTNPGLIGPVAQRLNGDVHRVSGAFWQVGTFLDDEFPRPVAHEMQQNDIVAGHSWTLNGNVLELCPDDALPALTSTLTSGGDVLFEPASITFLAVSNTSNDACR